MYMYIYTLHRYISTYVQEYIFIYIYVYIICSDIYVGIYIGLYIYMKSSFPKRKNELVMPMTKSNIVLF